jgi:KDO2-lipid IV(A) lauroyltransferase
MCVVARALNNPFFDRRLRELRERGGNSVVDSQDEMAGVRKILERLRRGGAVGILVDQCPKREKGELVPFFGRRAWSHRGPAVLALRSRATLLPAFIVADPERRGGHRIRFDEPIEPERTGDMAEDVLRLTARFQRVLEDEIRSRPEDWLWLHRRWKRSPDADGLYPIAHLRRRPPAPRVPGRSAPAEP